MRASRWSQPGSNRRPPACHAGALPAELWPQESRQSSFEVEISGSVDSRPLVVTTRPDAKIHLSAAVEFGTKKQEASIEIEAVHRDEIDFGCAIDSLAEPLACATRRVAAHSHDLPVKSGELALHSVQPPSCLEDKVESTSLHHRLVHADSELDRCRGYLRLCDCALLVGRKHICRIVSGSDNGGHATLFECSHDGGGRSAFAGASRDSSAPSSVARRRAETKTTRPREGSACASQGGRCSRA